MSDLLKFCLLVILLLVIFWIGILPMIVAGNAAVDYDRGFAAGKEYGSRVSKMGSIERFAYGFVEDSTMQEALAGQSESCKQGFVAGRAAAIHSR